MVEERLDILALSTEELARELAVFEQPAYRAGQIISAIYRSFELDFERMSSLPKPFREQLKRRFRPPRLTTVTRTSSVDGLTTKVLFSLADGQSVEAVLMQQDEGASERRSVCVSSQVGCPVGCAFCATGRSGYVRNLTVGEIVGQVLYFAEMLAEESRQRPITNVVFMGQGEPLLNLPHVYKAVSVLNAPDGFSLGARHMTISTAGVVPGIHEMAGWPYQVGLAVSLHAPDDDLRSALVPLNRKYPLKTLLDACRQYSDRTGRRVTFEYALIEGVNDLPEHGRRLASLLSGQLVHVNLIPLNATPSSTLRPTRRGKTLAFQKILLGAGIPCTVRVERGADIDAACGQLRQRHLGRSDAAKSITEGQID